MGYPKDSLKSPEEFDALPGLKGGAMQVW